MSGRFHASAQTPAIPQSRYTSHDLESGYDDDGYEREQQYYPHPMSDHRQPPYHPSMDNKSPPLDDDLYHHPDTVYPPIRTHPSHWNNTASDTTLHASPSKPFASSVDLETIGTDDGTERAINLTELKGSGSEIETGWRAALWPNSKSCRAYILVVLIETAIDMAVEGAILQQLDSMKESIPSQRGSAADTTTQTRQPIYLGIFVLAHVLQMILAIDAVYNKNTLQFLFLAVFNFTLLIYGGMQITEVRGNIDALVGSGATLPSIPINVLTILVPCVIAIAEVVYIALGYQIWKEFGWKVYKFLGADRNIKKIYAQYQVFQCLLKFDVFFWVGFSVQWIGLVLVNRTDFEFYATLAALPLSILLLVEGYLAARHENRWMMGSFMVGCVAGCGYFVYKAYRIFAQRNQESFTHLWKSLLIFASLSVILLLLTFISATVVMLNFDRGLKENMNKKEKQHKLERRATSHKGGPRTGGTLPPSNALNLKRMSIE